MYKAKIQRIENKKLIKGVFYDFNDTTVILINAKSKAEVTNYQFQFDKININPKLRIREY